MKRTAKAHWSGNLKEGNGHLTTQSGILDLARYSFTTRFAGEEKGTNPEELLAAAHAGCFTMAVSFALSEKGLTPTSLNTEAVLTMESFSITSIHLSIAGSVPGISASDFKLIVEDAANNCLISKALNVPVTSEALFVS